METDDFLRVLADEGRALAAAAALAGPDAPVPTCPGWRMRDLVLHTGAVHRWAAGYVRERHPERQPFPAPAVPDGELDGWFLEGLGALLALLDAAPADLACWTFLTGSPTPRHFWARRQAHETAVHRMDAELAAGQGLSPVTAEFAADGIDELLVGFHGRDRSRLRAERPAVLRVLAADRPGDDWTVHITDGTPRGGRSVPGTPADCEISGPATVLYPVLWNRQPWSAEVKVAGDAAVAALWRSAGGV
ncbi:maleylpyruvate isomerase N-terminal domain-containing protein [Streptomyces johnsoniae]|uniref:Maleylpyruvate isomerase family mycothiol-dependent enzyme n=1 Tax=Streptomyces johnsoniae TaxID=3075532 RepID=A0ABU2SF02_9ACTN|nr:maleylpyruvate isomerase N-terminal domain-containing protein [Streptomyces sp. DSM 41886]MDT0446325.1 maleylpyruvate isomerase family mycothiol-dependent enzyme [Streptomyces sp. DSM 41886]